jgi:WD40 repeat protein
MRAAHLLLIAAICSATEISVVPQTGHLGTVLSLAFSPDGTLLASGGVDAAVLIHDIAAGRQLRTIGGNPFEVSGLAWSSPGMVVAASDGTCLLDPQRGIMLAKAELVAGVFTNWTGAPDGSWALCAVRRSEGRQLSRRVVGRLDHIEWSIPTDDENPVISPDGARFVIRSVDGGLHIHDAATGARLISLPGAAPTVWLIGWSPDGRLLAAMHAGGVRVWDVAAKSLRHELAAPAGAWLRFSPDSSMLLAGGTEGKAGTMWRMVDGQAVAGSDLPADCEIALNRDGTRLARFQGDEVVVFALPQWQVLGRIAAKRVKAATWSPDGSLLAVASEESIGLYQTSTLNEIRRMRGSAWSAVDLQVSPDARRLYAAGWGMGTWSWDLATGEAGMSELRLKPPIALSADGRCIAGIVDSDGSVGVIRIADGVRLGTKAFPRKVYGRLDFIALSPDGGQFVASGGGHNGCWTTGSDTAQWEYAGNVCGAVWLPGGGWITAFGPDWSRNMLGAVLEFDPAGKVVRRFETDDPRSVALSPDGSLVAAPRNRDSTPELRIWQRADGRLLHTLTGHTWITQHVAFDADNRTVISCDMDGTARLWDARSGTAGPVLRGHGFRVDSAVFLPGTRLVATTGEDCTVRLWNRDDGHPVALSVPLPAGYVTVLPNGVYKASRGALDGVAMAVGMRAYPFEQFDLLLNRPDEVLAATGLADPVLVRACAAARAQRLQRAGIDPARAGDLASLPVVDLAEVPPPGTAERHLVLRVRASHPQEPVTRLLAFVDDVPVSAAGGVAVGDGRRTSVEAEVAVELLPGPNKIQIAAVSASGARSLLRTWSVTCTAQPEPRTLHVVAVGVSDYPGTEQDLGYAAKDARDIAAAFAASGHGYAAVDTLVLADAQATRSGVLALRSRLAATRPQDGVVLFIAGHGVLDQRLEYRYATADFDFAQPSAGGLTFSEVEGLLDGIPARQRLLLMDTCHAGEVEDGGPAVAAAPLPTGVRTRGLRRTGGAPAGGSAALVRSLFADLRRGAGAPVIASASGSEVAFESGQWSNGVFTMAVIETLRSAPAPLRVSTLRDRVSARVGELTGGAQNPVSRRENLANDFEVLGR